MKNKNIMFIHEKKIDFISKNISNKINEKDWMEQLKKDVFDFISKKINKDKNIYWKLVNINMDLVDDVNLKLMIDSLFIYIDKINLKNELDINLSLKKDNLENSHNMKNMNYVFDIDIVDNKNRYLLNNKENWIRLLFKIEVFLSNNILNQKINFFDSINKKHFNWFIQNWDNLNQIFSHINENINNYKD